MTVLPRDILAEKAAAVERHLDRVAARVPAAPATLAPTTDAADAVILHLWQALQITIDLAMHAAVRFSLPAPATYADAFLALAGAGVLPAELATRLARAAGFRHRIVHAYEDLDLALVTAFARTGPADLRAFLACLREHAG